MQRQPKEFGQQIEASFGLVELFAGYISKPEVTAVTPAYLVKGSKNVLVDYAQRVISRNGYKLYNQKNTGATGIKGSCEWQTSTGSEFSLRSYAAQLEFDYGGTYNTLLSNLLSPYLEFAKVLDYAEQQDVLLMVNGGSYTLRWSGGVSKVRASTATTLTKQGVLGPSATLVIGTPTISVANPAVVTLTAHGLVAGQLVQFSTTGALPAPIVAGAYYYVLAAGIDANDFEISLTNGGAAIVTTGGTQSGTHSVYAVNVTNAISLSFTASPSVGTIAATINDANGNFLNAGFATGDSLTVVGSVANSRQFTIASVTATTITLIMTDVLTTEAAGPLITIYNQTGPTWKSARFFSTKSGRSILYKGIAYTYSGGENTDTLQGLTAFPAVAVGDAVWQSVDVLPLSTAITSPFPNFFPNLIGVQLNMVFLASTASSMIFGSSAADYTNYTLTSPRAPGDPVQQPLKDGPCTCIVTIDTDAAILNDINTLVFGSGRDAFNQIDFHMSQDNSEELLRIIGYKNAKGSGLISKSAICPIKNNTVYISREPALDSLSQGNLEAPDGRKNVPISDPIKNDFDTYNFLDAHVIYYKRQILVALPAHGIVLIYDLMRNLWQPPQYLPVGRFAIIKDLLYGHSSVTNETYQLFTGTDDNGVFIPMIARFAYNNGGRRDRLKNMSLYWSDGYITANGLINMNTYFGFNGSRGYKTKTISGTDTKVVTSPTGIPFGNIGFGQKPFGGSTGVPIPGLPGANTTLLRFWQINQFRVNDYIEQFSEYTQNVLGAQFAIVAHGSDQFDAGTAAVGHTK